MRYLLGSWKAVKDVPVRMGNSAFTLSSGAIVSVTRVDEERQKVLIEIGPDDIDWFSHAMLKNFEQCI
jgi:hypothetical protein